MKINEHKIKKYLFGGVMLVLLLPLIQWKTKLFPIAELNGDIKKKDKVWFTKENWLSLKYQDSAEAWFNEEFGFRNTCVRLRNQVEFSLYNIAKAKEVVIGKEGYFYEKNYILAYTGKDYIGDEAIADRAMKLKKLQDTLEKIHITLVIALAPGKASFYPQYIPDEFGAASTKTNYLALSAALKKNSTNVIDMNKWFLQMRETAKYPLFPKTGIHWSRYGTVLAIDSIIKYIEKKRNIDLPSVITEKFVSRNYALNPPDDDLAKGMNLMFEPTPLEMGYPIYHIEDSAGKVRPTMISVADSYFMALFDQGISPKAFGKIDFWYYNQEVYHDSLENKTLVADVELPDELIKHDVLMIMATEANLSGIGWGYINEAYDYFFANKSLSEYDKKVKYWETKIIKEKEWFMDVQKKAIENKVPLDTMIRRDAVWMVDDEMKRNAK
ncbi:MAG: hypothetical protein IAF38_08950 [Bacteroidia bacterium]|nr:hypothetical protein [Bacteroidia bacterium]